MILCLKFHRDHNFIKEKNGWWHPNLSIKLILLSQRLASPQSQKLARKKQNKQAVFYLPLTHKDKERPKDDIGLLLKYINHANIKEWVTKYTFQVQTVQSLKTVVKFSFWTFSWLAILSLLNLSHLSCNTSVKCHISTSLLVAQCLNQLLYFLWPNSPVSQSYQCLLFS